MGGNQEDSHNRGRRRSLNKRILTNTTLNILVLVIICCVIMAFSMQSLANSILLDSLQPMARQSAKTVEANIHMMAERMMDIAGDPRMEASSSFDGQAGGAGFGGTTALGDREAVLTEAAEIYELHTIALYDLEGRLVQAAGSAPKNLDGSFFAPANLFRYFTYNKTDTSARSVYIWTRDCPFIWCTKCRFKAMMTGLSAETMLI